MTALPGRVSSVVRVVILGMSPFAAELIEQLAGHSGYELAGIIAERSDNPQQGRQWPILGTLADFDRIVNRVKPDLIVVATADRRG